MGKPGKRPPQVLEPLKPVDYIKYPDAIAGADVTRPRDIYSFLSLGYVSAETLRLRTQSPTDQYEHLRIAEGKLPSSIYSEWNDSSNPSTYVLFDTLNTHPKLPAIVNETCIEEVDESVRVGIGDEHTDNEDNDITGSSQLPRKSIINEEDHVINITQTYIFTAPGRSDDAAKYNKNVILPKIKPKKTVSGGVGESSKDHEHNSTTTATTTTTLPKPKLVQIDPNPTDISPRTTDMATNSQYLFGARPECLFLNHSLGDRNPLLRNPKDSPSQSGPKASPGLHDLKDYDEYPNVYWELRDGTITQPADLEADMIDRDLYRLRQISALKLNTIERTFQVSQDPFRRWRSKPGEPVFSPKQQQRPINYKIFRDRKAKEIPIYPQALSKPQLKVGVSPLKPIYHENSATQNQDDPLYSSRVNDITKNNHNEFLQYKPENEFDNIPALPAFDTPRDSSMGGITPREVVAASLESYRRMDEELASDERLGKIPIHKLHELRGKKHKQPIKTALVKVDLEPLDSYRREHVNAVAVPKAVGKNSKGVGHSHKLESYREQYHAGNDDDNTKMDTDRSHADKPEDSSKEDLTTRDKSKEENNVVNNTDDSSVGKKIPVSVSTLVLQPDLTRLSLYPPGDIINSWDVDTGTLLSSAAGNCRQAPPSPVVSDSSATSKERRKNLTITPLRPVKLEVFSEKAAGGGTGFIKIPTGRVSYHRNMPTYKLDLVNYPPSNARQSCQRSTSAGISDGFITHLTNYTHTSSGGSRQLQRVRSTGQTGDQDPNIPPKSTGADTGVSIRFGQQGHVIVSTSREGRRSR